MLGPYERTVCSCEECKACCKRRPGALAPQDLVPLLKHHGVDTSNVDAVLAFAEAHLRASPGALLGNTATGKTFRVPSITPKRDENTGVCHWLSGDGLCSIHEVAPAGCAYFSACSDSMSLADANARSTFMIRQQMDELMRGDQSIYYRLRAHLEEKFGVIEAVELKGRSR